MSPIWTIEVRDRMVRQTRFVCPRCGLDRQGAELEPQRWFTVLRLPAIPLATLDHVVRCEMCEHRSDIGVLEIPTTDLLAAYVDDALRHSVVTILRAGSGPTAAARAAAVATVEADGHDYGLDQLEADLVGLDDTGTRDRLARMTDELTAHGKQSFLHRMAALAQVDGELTPDQHRVLVDIGVALGMPAPHINGVITVATLDHQTV